MCKDCPMSYAHILDDAQALHADTVHLRRTLHRTPEIGLDLPRTRETVLAALDGLPLRVELHETTSGIVAVLEGSSPGPTVLLRGDMDALPLSEDTGLEFSSEVDGAMHACGHDLHTAMLVGAARLLSARRDDVAGKVVFMFQPGEEGYGGAKYMLDEGLLDVTGELPVRALALHVSSGFPFPGVACRDGAFMASADTIEITVEGAGGHASAPHAAIDPILVAAEIMTNLQTAITRDVNVFDPAVLTFARVHAGTTHNIIPATAVMEGTLRCISDATRDQMHDLIERVSTAVATAHRATAAVRFVDGYPVTVNDPVVAGEVRALAAGFVGEENVVNPPVPIMGAEDWSYVLERVPGAMAFLKASLPGNDSPPANHSNVVVFDEDVMVSGVALYAAFAIDSLRSHGG